VALLNHFEARPGLAAPWSGRCGVLALAGHPAFVTVKHPSITCPPFLRAESLRAAALYRAGKIRAIPASG